MKLPTAEEVRTWLADPEGGRRLPIEEVKGLHLDREKLHYRIRERSNGVDRTLGCIGRYPEMTPAQAVKKAKPIRAQLDLGIDPLARKLAERVARADTFAAIAEEVFTRMALRVCEATLSRQRGMYRNYLQPELGKRPISAIKAHELLRVIRKAEGELLAAGHNGDVPLRLKILAQQIFQEAEKTGRVDHNICHALTGEFKKNRDDVKRHFASVREIEKVPPLLRACWSYDDGVPATTAFLRLMFLLPVRPNSELRLARWAEFNLDGAVWMVPSERMKVKGEGDHYVPLPRQAIEILRELYKHTGTDESGFVFRGVIPKRAMSSNTANAALRRLGISTQEVFTCHGTRALFRTLGDEQLSFRPEWMELQLGHRLKDPNGGAYQRMAFKDERRKMLQRWADWLDAQRSPQPSNVIEFPRTQTAT
jgi:integrase